MKNHSTAMLQFSGYPLTVADKREKKNTKITPVLSVVRPKRKFYYYPSLQVSELVKKDENWDANWFGSYE